MEDVAQVPVLALLATGWAVLGVMRGEVAVVPLISATTPANGRQLSGLGCLLVAGDTAGSRSSCGVGSPESKELAELVREVRSLASNSASSCKMSRLWHDASLAWPGVYGGGHGVLAVSAFSGEGRVSPSDIQLGLPNSALTRSSSSGGAAPRRWRRPYRIGDTGGRAGDSHGGECRCCDSGETTAPPLLERGGI